jgi:hypothetical protein
MAYKDFTSAKAKKNFGLTTIEDQRFLPEIDPIPPSSVLPETLNRVIPWAIAVGNEKARSEAIINPVLLEVKYLLKGSVSVFSGEDFTVDPSLGLNGVCDFLMSQSAEQLAILKARGDNRYRRSHRLPLAPDRSNSGNSNLDGTKLIPELCALCAFVVNPNFL